MPISFRYRFVGEMWQQNFMCVLKITENGLLLNDEIANKLIVIQNLSNIVQFELDGSLHDFEPNFHYEISFSSAFGSLKNQGNL